MIQHTKTRTVPYRRKREQRTNYRKRLRLLFSQKPRLVVRVTNQRILGQVVHFDAVGDRVAASADAFELKRLGWTHSGKNLPAAYLTGFLLAKKALAAGVNEGILDTGSRAPLHKGKVYAFLKGAVDGGLNVPHQEDVFPDDARIRGEHVQQYLKQVPASGSKGAVAATSQFAQYLKSSPREDELSKQFATVKAKIAQK